MEPVKIIIIVCISIAVICTIVGPIVTSNISKNWDILIIKKKIRNNETINDYDVSGRTHEKEIKELLLKSGYSYQIIELEPEKRTFYGVGVVDFADGKHKYQIYYGENRFMTNVSEQDYLYAKEHLGETFIVKSYDYVWKRNEE